ncbi:MAG: hypothetical protein GX044_05105 [Firmicutes bacterium]|jgi:hypothetical protein|nr:hypothetical protein [Bacillota bacterium]
MINIHRLLKDKGALRKLNSIIFKVQLEQQGSGKKRRMQKKGTAHRYDGVLRLQIPSSEEQG